MRSLASERPASARGADPVASLALSLVAIVALAGSGFLPWWTMEARAPQYGQRTLHIEVNPRRVTGDVFEMDALGHYVGIAPLGKLAPVERSIAPLGLAAALLGLAAAPFLRRRALRALAVLPAVAMPLVFLVDLSHWMKKSTTDRDPEAALSLTITTIDAKLLGDYQLGQFMVEARAAGGLDVAGLAGLLGLGLVFAAPLPFPRRKRARAVVAAGAAVALCLAPRGAAAAETVVAEGETLAAAVARAADGDTVVVPAGVYRERLVLGKRVRLAGQPGATLDGGGEGTILRIAAAGVEVSGLLLRNGGDSYAREDAGVRIEKVADVRIEHTRIEDTLFGIFAVQADRCRIEDNAVVGKDLPHERRGDGIRLWYSSGCVLRRNLVERSRDVIIWYSADTLAEDNEVRNSRYGLHYMYSDHNRFRHNRFEDNQVGAAIMYSHDVELRQNAFSFSNGVAAYGILIKDADDIFIEENRLVGNATALFLDGAPQSRGGRVTVHANLLARNDVGLALQPLSRGVEVWENAFVGNVADVQVQGSGTAEANVWAVGGRGNYWSEAVTYDRDGDGVSELPYHLEDTYEGLADRFPSLAFFRATPGADAIDAAARLFPLFATRPKLTDPHPLVRPALTPWTGGEHATAPGGELASAGAGLLALGGLGLVAARRGLA